MNLTAPVLAAVAKLLSGATLRWHECQPDTCQRVYFANHTSHLDALVLWSSLPGEIRDLTRPVAAKDYWSQGVVRRYMAKCFNAILIDRDEIKVHQSPVDLMIRYIETGAFEAVITHNRYTLLNRSAGPLLDKAAKMGIAVLNAGSSNPSWSNCAPALR